MRVFLCLAQVLKRGIPSHSRNVTGKYEKSAEEAKLALGIDPDFSIGYTNLAVSYMALERMADAESTLQRASERKLEIPDFFVLRYAIAFLKDDKAELDRVAAEAQEKPGVDDWMANSAGYVSASASPIERTMATPALPTICW